MRKESRPDAIFARRILLAEIEAALDELPAAQRETFLAHEIDGRNFSDIARETDLGINALLSPSSHHASGTNVEYRRD